MGRPSAIPTDPKPRSPWRRGRVAFLATAGVLSLLIAVGAGFAIATIRHVELNIPRLDVGPQCRGEGCLSNVDPICPRKACTFLVLGSDSRQGLTRKQQKVLGNSKWTSGQRSDTIILVQIDVQKDRTVVLSIPRDLRVPIPGHGFNKINTAFNYGPNLMVKTVEQLTGLQINHYVEVNFTGFERLVDAVGGIPVCIYRPLVDKVSHLMLPHAGCYDLRGPMALAFVRARHIEGDAIPDFSRISRQQLFMRALIGKALSLGSVFHLPDLIRAVQSNLIVDKNMNIYKLQDLTKTLGRLGQRHVIFRIVPALPLRLNGVDYLQLVEPEATRLFRRMRQGRGLGNLGIEAALTPLSPANVAVQVLDATSGGRAQQVVEYLERAGFVVLPLRTAPSDLTRSVILSGRTGAKPSEAVAAYFTSLEVVNTSRHTKGSIVTVVVAADFPPIEGL
jgi:LCP family protein required for cell wall assembly